MPRLDGRPIALVLLLVAITGGFAVRRATTGRSPVAYSVTLAGLPSKLLIDARTRRAFVVSTINVNTTTVTTLDLDTGARLRTVRVGIAARPGSARAKASLACASAAARFARTSRSRGL